MAHRSGEIMADTWTIPADLRPLAGPARLSDSAKLQIMTAHLEEIERMLRDGLPRRPGSKARMPVRDRDRAILAYIAGALSI